MALKEEFEDSDPRRRVRILLLVSIRSFNLKRFPCLHSA